MRLSATTLFLASTAALAAGQAWAQDAPVGLAEIVVTAEHRAVNVQTTALTITAISGDALTKEGIGASRDLLDSVAGLDMTFGTSNAYIGLYGLMSGSGNMYADAVMSFNYGGIPLARQTAAASAMYDLERVEVLKGPQGTLYGRNATVGVLNVIINRPKNVYEANLNVSGGNYGALNTSGAVNIPVNDQIATRVAFQTTRHDGYFTNGFDDANNYGARASILYKPTDDLSLLVWGDSYRDRSKGPYSTTRYYLSPTQEWIVPGNPWFGLGPAGSCSNQVYCPSNASTTVGGINTQSPPGAFIDTGPNGLGALSVTGDSSSHSNADQDMIVGELNWTTRLGLITVLGSHVTTKVDFLNSANGSRIDNDTLARENTLEARLSSVGDTRLKWTLGGFYFFETQRARQVALTSTGWGDLNTPHLDDLSYAAFADGTFSITERLRLNGGLRYSYEKKTQDGFTTAAGLTPAQQVILVSAGSQCFTASIANKVSYDGLLFPTNFCAYPNGGVYEDDKVSWKIGVEFDLAPQSLLYLTAKNGFRAGGFTVGTGNFYKPEILTAYEFGSKNRFFDGRVQANFSAFYWKYQDQQLSQIQTYKVNGIVAGQTSYAFNVDGNLKGAELDVQALVTGRDKVAVNVLNVTGKFDQTPLLTSSLGVTAALTDVDRYNLPEWTVDASYNHMFDVGRGTLDAGVKAHYESSAFLRLAAKSDLTAGDLKDAYVKWDADLTYKPTDGTWTVGAFVRNITNEAVVGVGSSGQATVGSFFKPSTDVTGHRFASLEPPRTYGVRLTASFGGP